MTTQKD